MKTVSDWLCLQPFSGSAICVWHLFLIAVLAFAVGLVIAVIVKRTGKKSKTVSLPVTARLKTERAEKKPQIVANMQGIGSRSEQQDSFYISPLSEMKENGLLCILCDGMGGMYGGREISSMAISCLSSSFGFFGDMTDPLTTAEDIKRVSADIFARYMSSGGTTLVMAYVFGRKLWFWCAGDSDLMLLRGGRLFSVNCRQEYLNDLIYGAARGRGSVTSALNNPQKGALTSFIGGKSLELDMSYEPLRLEPKDKLFLCSDGVSDVVSPGRLTELLERPAAEDLAGIENEIALAGIQDQDNYTAISVTIDS